MAPPLTFAIPCFNGAAHLRPLLESLLAQTRVDCHLLLVDDGSTDDSLALARRVVGTRLEVVQNNSSLGIPGNWNRCIEHARTEFICLAHQDDVYAPDFASSMLAALATNPRAAAAHCRMRTIDARGEPLRSAQERYKQRFWRALPAVESSAQSLQRLFAGNFVGCPTLVYRACAVAEIGAFDAQYRFAPDWEWLLRALSKDWQLVAVPRDLVAYRRHPEQATQRAVASLQRYREEHALLALAHRLGGERGWLAANARSTAMRDNLLYDASVDLQARRFDATQDKLTLLGELDPPARRSAPARVVAAAARLGWPGRRALLLALSGYIAWQARGWHRGR